MMLYGLIELLIKVPWVCDEDIPMTPPISPAPIDDEDVAAKKSNEIRIGPITRARAKLLEQ
jgi:hypothetical protein